MCWCINHQGRGMYPCLKRYLATLMRSTTTEDDTYLLFEKSRKDVGFQMNKIFQVNVCPWLNTRGVRITNCIILQSVFLENVLPRIVWRLLLPQRGQYFEIVLARNKNYIINQLTILEMNSKRCMLFTMLIISLAQLSHYMKKLLIIFCRKTDLNTNSGQLKLHSCLVTCPLKIYQPLTDNYDIDISGYTRQL